MSSSSRTDFRIKAAPGLQLRVTDRASKTWALAYKSPLTGKWTKAAIGTYPEIGLAEAKGRAQELSVEIRKGKDPGHHITAAQLAVDRQIEESEIPFFAVDLQLRPNRPNVARSQRRLGTDELALVSG